MAKMQINLTNTNEDKTVSDFKQGEVVLIKLNGVTSAYMVVAEEHLVCLQDGKFTYMPGDTRGKPTKATLELEVDLG